MPIHEFARELRPFVAEVRDIFSDEAIRHSIDHLERIAVIEDGQATDDDNSDFLMIPPSSLPQARTICATKEVAHVGRARQGIKAVPFDTSSMSCLGHLCVIEQGAS